MTKLMSAALLSILVFSSCEKTTSYEASDVPYFAPLTKPAAGTGYQIHIEPFPVQPNFEREIYVNKLLGNTQDVYLTGFEMKARPGTHHMIAYKPEAGYWQPPLNVLLDQNNPNNTINLRSSSNALPLFISPAAYFNFDFPAGYAIKANANANYIMNSHYFNKTNEVKYGELYVNFKTSPLNQVQQLLELNEYSTDDFVLPPNQTTTIERVYPIKKTTKIKMLVSHYHKYGKKFDAYVVGGTTNGQQIYTSTDYENPVWKTFANELVLQQGQSIKTVVRYENTTNRTIKFGVTSEDEMNFLFSFEHY